VCLSPAKMREYYFRSTGMNLKIRPRRSGIFRTIGDLAARVIETVLMTLGGGKSGRS